MKDTLKRYKLIKEYPHSAPIDSIYTESFNNEKIALLDNSVYTTALSNREVSVDVCRTNTDYFKRLDDIIIPDIPTNIAYIERKSTVWERYYLPEGGYDLETIQQYLNGHIELEFEDVEEVDSGDFLEINQNKGNSTVEVYDKYNRLIYENGESNKVHNK